MNDIDLIKRLGQRDLNLLVTFKVLADQRHVTRAAKVLGISQSAMSHALRRLRTTFEDELFVKVPTGVVPTPKAEALVQRVDGVLDSLKQIYQEEDFSPAQLKRCFRIRTTDLIEHLLAAPLLELQRKEAPGLQVAFAQLGFSLPKQELEAGSIDLAMAGFFGAVPDGFYRQLLFQDSFMCCVAKSARGRSMTLKRFIDLPHILIAPGGELSGAVDRALAKKKLKRQIVLGTSGFLAAGWAAAAGEAILTAPRSLLRSFETYLPIQTFPLPFTLPKIKVVQVWHQRMHGDPGHRWLRERVVASFESLREAKGGP